MSLSIEQMPMLRIFFEKTSRAKYISHLDTMRTLSRAFKRSGLPVWYTQGFNPHIYMNFALPLSLGYESLCESVDVRMTREIPDEEVLASLNAALPPGFRAVRAASPVMEPGAIAWADYDVRLTYSGANVTEVSRKLDAFLALPVIEVSKKTKKGEKLVDIKPHCSVLDKTAGEDVLALKLRAASGNTFNINPSLFLKAFYSWSAIEPDGVKITRAAILTADMQDFM